MNIEKTLDRRFLSFRSILGFYRWQREKLNIIKDKNASLSEKIWCIRHGFSVSDYNIFGHENMRKNYRDYLSVKQYNQLHPINGMFTLWIDDKLTVKHVLSRFSEHLPLYYFDIEDGAALRLPDCPDSVQASGYEGIVELVRQEKKLALKQLLGTYGRGFYRLEYADGQFYITGEKATEEELIRLLKSLNHYLVTEFITNHETLRGIWPEATNTLRVIMANVDQEPIILRSFIRFGSKKSKGVDNAHAGGGGIMSVVDEDTGKILYTFCLDKKGYASKITNHPDSGASFDITIPNWDLVIEKCLQIGRSYPELKYMGMDVAITDDGFKILEINSLSGLRPAQLKEPLLKDPKTRRAFESFGLKLR